jgi:nucleoside-diphosphate-sugar epimerase
MITVVGAGGYIGSALVQRLVADGTPHLAVGRDTAPLFSQPLGTVILCAGVTTDFTVRPLDTVDAHVSLVVDLFRRACMDRFVYLSSTRLYMGGSETGEDAAITVRADDPNYLYNLSKLLGENLCLYAPCPVTVVRLSNVYGFDGGATNFLPIIILQALKTGTIELQSSLESAKDYISLLSAVDLLITIARGTKEKAYNLAAGANITNREITGEIARLTGCRVRVRENSPTLNFPSIDNKRLVSEFGPPASNLITDMATLVNAYRKL